ncbi:unnamed protein product [Clavelina lepadiformis]|uniref:Amino acid transporter transmembrane domain-containing protein n=1 Tax=Clavelina lepadiformis TaxID=159417 RepID=A0ABP0GV67_CLALP
MDTSNENTKLLNSGGTCENGNGQLHDYEINEGDETESVEIKNERVEVKATGTFGAVFIVVNAAMGAGLLNMPKAFAMAGGISTGVTIEMCFLVLIIGSLMILGYCAHVYQCTTYQQVIETVCGKFVGVITECCIILYMFGTSIAMIIIVGDQFDKVMEAIVGPDFCHHWYMNRKFTMCVFSIAVIFPLCIPRNIGFLRHASVVGVIATIVVMVTVVVKFTMGTYTPSTIQHSPKSLSETLSAIPTIFFAYQCHVSSVPVYASLKKKTSSNWVIVISCAIFLCALSYTLTGICGYLTFGDDVKSDVLQSYDAKDDWVIIARVSIVIAMLTSYPIVHFCGRAALLTLFVKMKLFSQNPTTKFEKVRRYLVTSVWFLTSLVLALFIPNIGQAIAVVGGFAGCFIVLFPGLCLTKLAIDLIEDAKTWWSYILFIIGLLYTLIGSFLFGEITTEAIMNDIYETSATVTQCYS